MAFNLDLLFQKSELIPVIIQEVDTLEVLMLDPYDSVGDAAADSVDNEHDSCLCLHGL